MDDDNFEDCLDDELEDDEESMEDADEEQEGVEEDYVIADGIDHEAVSSRPKVTEEEFIFEVLSANQVVELIQDIIRDVNLVLEVSCKSLFLNVLTIKIY